MLSARPKTAGVVTEVATNRLVARWNSRYQRNYLA
jgi:hypothetical protein